MKVAYTTVDGSESTAYVDGTPDLLGLHHGQDKYTDEDVRVRFDEPSGTWYEVTAP